MDLQDQQASLFITDEKSAIIWLNVQLSKSRQSYSEIQPKFFTGLASQQIRANAGAFGYAQRELPTRRRWQMVCARPVRQG